MNRFSYDQRRAIYNKALLHYGLDNQLNVAIEEMSEVVKAITKLKRAKNGNGNFADCVADLTEEIADATIMLEQLRLFFAINDDVCEAIDAKVERLKTRIESATKKEQ